MALLLGFVLVAALGIAHQYGLLAVRAIKPNSSARTQAAITAIAALVKYVFFR